MQTDLVLKRPIITEKTMLMAQKQVFTFEVNPTVSKTQIAKVVEETFNVSVVDVATSVLKVKAKRFGRKRLLKKFVNSKKAFVELKKGQKIDLFEIAEEKKT